VVDWPLIPSSFTHLPNYPLTSFLRCLCASVVDFVPDSCSPLPASLSHPPPPIRLLLQTKGERQFERTVDSLSTPLFCLYSGVNPFTSTLSFWFSVLAKVPVVSCQDFLPTNIRRIVAQSTGNVKRIFLGAWQVEKRAYRILQLHGQNSHLICGVSFGRLGDKLDNIFQNF
jgi:hypothetical protein